MLHFLIGVALCLFIGERLVHYWSAYRLHRDVRRHLAWPPPEPKPGRALGFVLTTVTVLFVALFILGAMSHG
jgi:hypothetical protein